MPLRSPSAWMPAVWVNTASPVIGLLAGMRRPLKTSVEDLVPRMTAAAATVGWALALKHWTDAVMPWRDAFIAAFHGVIQPHDPNAQNVLNKFAAPSWDHWLGTNDLGQDLWSRIMVGAGVALYISVRVVVSLNVKR